MTIPPGPPAPLASRGGAGAALSDMALQFRAYAAFIVPAGHPAKPARNEAVAPAPQTTSAVIRWARPGSSPVSEVRGPYLCEESTAAQREHTVPPLPGVAAFTRTHPKRRH
ncbi:hypothetical protein GCM10010327_52840 [Streptomyces nitrosporeus]|nr:hypothetical protein GCM10010327_52840 [Streptomyces nitrosporeus]